MQRVNCPSFKALSEASGVSAKQIRTLRRGNINALRLETVYKLSQVLQLSIADFLATFADYDDGQTTPAPPTQKSLEPPSQVAAELRQEYDRLQAKLDQQQHELRQAFQQESIQILESLLLQLPTASHAAQQNPQVPAVKLLPLLRPIADLLNHWGIAPIATVGAEIEYDPQQHQLLNGHASSGERVRVRYVGYRQGDRLLYRAKVSPIA
jgi:DNA-binding Xre family transcriptional regulator